MLTFEAICKVVPLADETSVLYLRKPKLTPNIQIVTMATVSFIESRRCRV